MVQIIVQSHFDRVSLILALKPTEPVSQLVTQTAVKDNKCSFHFSRAKEISIKAMFFFT